MAIRHVVSRCRSNWPLQQLNKCIERLTDPQFVPNVDQSRFYSEQKDKKPKEHKSALIIFTKGAEEMEVVISADVLRRAEV